MVMAECHHGMLGGPQGRMLAPDAAFNLRAGEERGMKIIKAGQDEVVARLPRGAKIDAEPRQVAPEQIDMKIMQGWKLGEREGSIPPRPGDVFEGFHTHPDVLGAASRSQGCRRCSPPTCGRGSWRPPSATLPAARPGSWCATAVTAAAAASPPSPAATAPSPTSRRWRTAWPSSGEPGRATTISSRSQVRPHTEHLLPC